MIKKRTEIILAILILVMFSVVFTLIFKPAGYTSFERYQFTSSVLFLWVILLLIYYLSRNRRIVRKLAKLLKKNDFMSCITLLNKAILNQPKLLRLKILKVIVLGISGEYSSFYALYSELESDSKFMDTKYCTYAICLSNAFSYLRLNLKSITVYNSSVKLPFAVLDTLNAMMYWLKSDNQSRLLNMQTAYLMPMKYSAFEYAPSDEMKQILEDFF